MSDELVTQEQIAELVDKKISETVDNIYTRIVEDRARAVKVFNELNEIFLQGGNDPDMLRELNKAQEMVQATSDSLIKVLTTLARLKTGSDKVQIANINASNKGELPDKATLVEILEKGFANDIDTETQD